MESKNTSAEASSPSSSNAHTPPSISLPKGGGAIRGIGEKFTTNPVTGSGSLTLPIATSSARSGLNPQISLTYDSGTGNGPFGIGWHLSAPSITRKTDKGLPRYQDSVNSDVFLLSGAEDLVPLLKPQQHSSCSPSESKSLQFDETRIHGHIVRRYKPRIEGLFTRIERWTCRRDGEVHWRTITPDNVTTLYGVDRNSRIPCPAQPGRIFSWLICETWDSKGNAILYRYKEEDSAGVDVGSSDESNRTALDRSANRYLKCIKYGNCMPNRDGEWKATRARHLPERTWMFSLVFDYGEHSLHDPTPEECNPWTCRQDAFSSYRAGFEVRTYRLCHRTLMFHHFQDELGTANCLVSSMEFSYLQSPTGSFHVSVTRSGYVHQREEERSAGYLKKSLPPLQFHYSTAPDPDVLARLPTSHSDSAAFGNLSFGLNNSKYKWIDLDGEGLPGIFSSQTDGFFYKRNLGVDKICRNKRCSDSVPKFAPFELLLTKPNMAVEDVQFVDLAGDGQIDLVQMENPISGFYERTTKGNWASFRQFASWPNIDFRDPDLRFIDLNGDGHADILITEHEAFYWYPSLAEDGFGPAQRVSQSFDEETGPRLILSDNTQSVYLADFSGDGLMDLARIRNGEVCYWPNLGYGLFGAKVSMRNSPHFDAYDQFNQDRIRLADVDGSGTTDIIYLFKDGIDIYHNESGNAWSHATHLTIFPHIDNFSNVGAVDILGSGTACLVWSSTLPGDSSQSMRYIDLVAGRKPHLLVKIVNNLGSETRISYTPSTRFYTRDKEHGEPWITRLPFPVHCVEKQETYDRISHNRFVTRYAYHHGYFDGFEREFRGFGMVEQWDTEEFGSVGDSQRKTTNSNEAFHTPPVHTKTWFHTGVSTNVNEVSCHMAHEYYRRQTLLDDTVLPTGDLTFDEMREARRSLKGSILRQEIYADDGTSTAKMPYSVSERNYTIKLLQARGANCHSIFYSHSREAITYNYERNAHDPRVNHTMSLQIDQYGNVLKSITIGYGRRTGRSCLEGSRKAKQEQLLITYTENDYTNAVNKTHQYRTPMACESRTYQITGLDLDEGLSRFTFNAFCADDFASLRSLCEVPYENRSSPRLREKRLIKRARTLYRSDDLCGLLPNGQLESLALPGEEYKLVLTSGLVKDVFRRRNEDGNYENLLSGCGDILSSQPPGGAGYVELDGNGHWWAPSGRIFFHPEPNVDAHDELGEAKSNFFMPRRFTDPFGSSSTVTYDDHNILPVCTRDPLDNTVQSIIDYRVLQPRLVIDANDNRSEVAFDALGMVVGTAVMGKVNETLGDSLEGFQADLSQKEIDEFFTEPSSENAFRVLKNASTRFIYDLNRYWKGKKSGKRTPTFAATLAREKHSADASSSSDRPRIQIGFSYSDGFGREIQKKSRAGPGPLERGEGKETTANSRWITSGWTIFNNKGKPVRQYEPFFDDTNDYRFSKQVGVSPILFYDPLGRSVATLNPDHTWQKIVFDAWQQKVYDSNDTVLTADPAKDSDVGQYFSRLASAEYLPTWYEARSHDEQDREERTTAIQTAAHANTPTVTHFDALGRTFLTIIDNGQNGSFATELELDIEGNQLEVIDAEGRAVIRYDYDMTSNRIHQASMEASERWMLKNVLNKSFFVWNSRGFRFRNEYDPLLRPTNSYVQAGNEPERLVGRVVYGEVQPDSQQHNLRGKTLRVFDQAGIVTTDAYDFKGNLLRTQRQLAQNYKETLDWCAEVKLEEDVYTTHTCYDALNRVVEQQSPDRSIIRSGYNEASLLERIDVTLAGEQADGDSIDPRFVKLIKYNAKGQRLSIDYGNGTCTSYAYDLLTFRLRSMRTLRDGSESLQDLHYTYDPAGNITYLRDDAQQTVFFRNHRVTPTTEYTYDALYRLIEATGREHLGQVHDGQPRPPSAPSAYNNSFTVTHPGDGNAMGSYVEEYTYDGVGNILSMKHRSSDCSRGDWTRKYCYEEPSQLEPHKHSNRLSSTSVRDSSETYSYDVHGNMTSMSHLSSMQWNYADQMQSTSRQAVNHGIPETTYYVYDSSGQRVRKVTERHCHPNGEEPTRLRERIYIGSIFELYLTYNPASVMPALSRSTLHVSDGSKRIAIVESLTFSKTESNTSPTRDGHKAPNLLVRYQLTNHLSSSTLELDANARILTYEEYYPYGSTSYLATSSRLETPKRYRYTFCEHDEETSLSYHTLRYYIPWLGRWTSTDPAASMEASNRYEYAYNNPMRFSDPGGAQPPPTQDSDPPSSTTPTQAPEMSPEKKAAWARAEAENYSDESVLALTTLILNEQEARGGDRYTRQIALELATVRATQASRNWNAGNYGTALVTGAAAVVESYGTVVFGDSNAKTVRNALVTAAVSVGIGALGGYFTAGKPSVSVAFKPGVNSRIRPEGVPGSSPIQARVQPGHNYAGVNAGGSAETVWSDLAIGRNNAAMVEIAESAPKGYSVATVPVSSSMAARAQSVAASQAATTEALGSVGQYRMTTLDCTTYASSVLNAGGVWTPPLSTPYLNYVAVSLQSPATAARLLSVAAQGLVAEGLNSLDAGVTSREMEMQQSLPSEHGL